MTGSVMMIESNVVLLTNVSISSQKVIGSVIRSSHVNKSQYSASSIIPAVNVTFHIGIDKHFNFRTWLK